MDLLQLVDLLELGSREQKTSYATPLKLVALGKVMGLNQGTRVIDYGCGKAQALLLWGRYFGISGLGIEISRRFCEEAEERLRETGLSGGIEIVCTDAATYPVPHVAYDVACCIGASFIWGGFRPTLRALKQVVGNTGQIVVGEPYYIQTDVPDELIEFEGDYRTEVELLRIMHEEGLDLKQIYRASNDDRDWYTAFWSQKGQEMYLKYMREYQGFALYLMQPRCEEVLRP
jgi:SAM-dependent methyltransferase